MVTLRISFQLLVVEGDTHRGDTGPSFITVLPREGGRAVPAGDSDCIEESESVSVSVCLCSCLAQLPANGRPSRSSLDEISGEPGLEKRGPRVCVCVCVCV